MQKLILSLMVLMISPLTVQADNHAIPGPGEGSFTTLMVQAPDVSAYIEYLNNNPDLFRAFNATAAGVCVTKTGHDYPGEMFVWNAFSDVTGAMEITTAYDPDQAPKNLAKLRTPKYSLAWKPLKPFVLSPGFERVTRVKIKPENVPAYIAAATKLEAAIRSAGHDFNFGIFQPLGGGVHETGTFLLRGISPNASETGRLIDDFYAGAAWGQLYLKASSLIDEVVRDTYEECQQIYTAE
jgi:hypothetical protein